MNLVEMISWAQANPEKVIAFLGSVALAARAIVKYVPNPTPGTVMYYVVEVCKFLGTVIPTNKVDHAPKPVTATVGTIRDISTGVVLTPDQPRTFNTASFTLADTSEGRDRPFLRRRIRAIAKRNGVDISEMDDADIDAVISRARAKAGEKGPIRDFLAWIVANPQIILQILMLFMGDKPNDAVEVSA